MLVNALYGHQAYAILVKRTAHNGLVKHRSQGAIVNKYVNCCVKWYGLGIDLPAPIMARGRRLGLVQLWLLSGQYKSHTTTSSH